ncbi:MAG TPA: toll/interleukin-1 receptor domain-containing protein [Caulobacteraceae bacterium]
MAYAFVAYEHSDEARVARLAGALAKVGIDVWWHRVAPVGENLQAVVEAKLEEAACVIVVWSTASVGPRGHAVRDEARRGLDRGALIPVLIDKVTPPIGFGEVQGVDLSAWKGALNNPFFRDLARSVASKLEGAENPTPRGPRSRVARRLILGSFSSAAIATLAAIMLNTFGVASSICTTPGLQPSLSDSCGSLNLGDRPTRIERQAWEARKPGSCPALRTHIERFPEGAYRSEAADLLAARRVTDQTVWAPATRSLVIYVSQEGGSAPTEDTARTRALARAGPEAERLCRGFAAGTLFRFVSAAPRADAWSCSRSSSGEVCGFSGQAVCQVEEKSTVEHETCAGAPPRTAAK